MSFVIKSFILVFLLGSFLAEKMTSADWTVCNSCLDIISKLKKSKNSSSCENSKLENDLMCYEIYYYLYYFQSDLFFNDTDSIKNECSACSYLDKCQFFECINKKRKLDNMKFMQLDGRSKINFKMLEKNNLKITNKEHTIKNANHIHQIENFDKFNQINENLIRSHLSIIQSKTKDILNKLLNLAEVNIHSLNVKKNLINLFLFQKLKSDNKLNISENFNYTNSTDGTGNTFVKIKNHNFEENYLRHVKKLVEEFMNLSLEYDKSIEEEKDVDKILKISTLYLQSYNELNILVDTLSQENKKMVESILKDFTEEKFKDSDVIRIEDVNRKKFRIHSNITDLSGIKININNKNQDKSYKNENENDSNIISNLNFTQRNLNPHNKDKDNNEYDKLSIIIEKLSKIEKEQETFKILLMKSNSTLYTSTRNNNSNQINSKIFTDLKHNFTSKLIKTADENLNLDLNLNLNKSEHENYTIPYNNNILTRTKMNPNKFNQNKIENTSILNLSPRCKTLRNPMSRKIIEEPTINFKERHNIFKLKASEPSIEYFSKKNKKTKRHRRKPKHKI